MSAESGAREPVYCQVDGRTYYFFCRLFPDERRARDCYRLLAEQTAGSNASLFLIRELEEEMTWGILLFSEHQIEMLAFSPLIYELGQPYRSRFLADAVRRRQAIQASRTLGSEHFDPSGLLGRLDPKKLL